LTGRSGAALAGAAPASGGRSAVTVDRLDRLEDVENRYRPGDYREHLVPFLRGALSVLP
jgi:hypothetical protein